MANESRDKQIKHLGNVKNGIQTFEVSFELLDKFRCKVCIRQVAADNGASDKTFGNPGCACKSVGASAAESNNENFGQRKIVEKLLNILHKIKVTALWAVRAEAIPWTVDADEEDAMHKRTLSIEVALKTAAEQPVKIPTGKYERDTTDSKREAHITGTPSGSPCNSNASQRPSSRRMPRCDITQLPSPTSVLGGASARSSQDEGCEVRAVLIIGFLLFWP